MASFSIRVLSKGLKELKQRLVLNKISSLFLGQSKQKKIFTVFATISSMKVSESFARSSMLDEVYGENEDDR